MPALSPTMEEGKLAKWLVKEGDEVHSGDVLAEIETDKATMEFEAVDEGRIGKILIPEGTEGVKVNEPIAELLQDGEETSKPSPGQRTSPPVSPEGKAAPPAPDQHGSSGRGNGTPPGKTGEDARGPGDAGAAAPPVQVPEKA